MTIEKIKELKERNLELVRICNKLYEENIRLELKLDLSEHDKQRFIKTNETLGNVSFENQRLKTELTQVKALLAGTREYRDELQSKLNECNFQLSKSLELLPNETIRAVQ